MQNYQNYPAQSVVYTGRKRTEKPERLAQLPEMVPIYENEHDGHPDALRVSFEDGSTAVYEIRRYQPHPMTIKSIEIIRKWNTGIMPEEPKRRKWRKP
ncbi:MAG: hypothetical protein IJQ88_05265 [Clostridia bacterium]|nr:hypothetical protein [Clostridia bacterium]MBQ9401522.1 hypothetical protein [Clostridia bacterium]